MMATTGSVWMKAATTASSAHVKDPHPEAHVDRAPPTHRWADDDIVTYGAGSIANQDCDNVASGVGWGNRNGYVDYQFSHDQGLWSTYEVCGYYQTNW